MNQVGIKHANGEADGIFTNEKNAYVQQTDIYGWSRIVGSGSYTISIPILHLANLLGAHAKQLTLYKTPTSEKIRHKDARIIWSDRVTIE